LLEARGGTQHVGGHNPIPRRRDHLQRSGTNRIAVAHRDAEPAADRRALARRRRSARLAHLRRRPAWDQAVRSRPGAQAADPARRESLLSMIGLQAHSRRLRLAHRGSVMLEALVAILIFSFGVLGLVGVLAASIRATNDARYRAEAANLANAVIGDMWATAATQLDPQFGTGGPRLAAWQNLVARELPSASGANAPLVDLAQP